MSFFYRIISQKILKKLLINFRGNLIIIFPNKSRYILGKGNSPTYFHIKNNFFLIRVLINGVSAIGYGYYKGEWVTNNLSYVVKLGLKNINTIKSLKIKQRFFYKIQKLFALESSNTITKSKKQISFHYDLGNLFYSFWLDKSMTYSSAIFNKKNISLESAQDNKYKSLVKLAQINKQNKVLEIGCGWGGFTSYVSNKIGSKIIGITISKNQYEYATNLQKKNVSIKFLDYKKIKKKYDKIVSIEMFEAVGKEFWNVYFKKLKSLLNQNGIIVLQIITIKDNAFDYYKKNPDFIQKHIFPGGMLPSVSMLKKILENNKLKIIENNNYAEHYAKTLNNWRNNFNSSLNKIKDNGFDDKFVRLWNYYLAYCESGFKTKRIGLNQIKIMHN